VSVNITKENVFEILKEMRKGNKKRVLNVCYEIMRKEVYPEYSSLAVIAEMSGLCGLSRGTIQNAIYSSSMRTTVL
jgi:hypothetical protein